VEIHSTITQVQDKVLMPQVCSTQEDGPMRNMKSFSRD